VTSTFQIAIVGPECSGKTTLARQLGNQLKAPVVPEIARDYLDDIGRDYSKDDVNKIAVLQRDAALDAQKQSPQALIHDTEMLTIKIWQEEKWEEASELVKRLWREQSANVYLLCFPDLPWEDDGLRENPTDRVRLFELYRNQLEEASADFHVIDGTGEARLQSAIQAIEELKQ
jgi:nicotinamide riboside kinase